MANSLFTPISIRGTEIRNRVVLPPIVCFGWAGSDGLVTDRHVEHYAAFAEGGAGLIIVEAACVHKDGRLTESQLGIWSDEHTAGLRRIVDACHHHGAVVLVQIHHGGCQTAASVAETAVAPSEHRSDGRIARALSVDEIHALRVCFVASARRAEEAGFDGVELHGAHGYLLSQFASPVVNQRADEYGGTLDGRMRFAREIIGAIRGAMDETFIIGCRMGGNEPTLENGIRIARSLEAAGVDLLHVSTGISSEEFPPPAVPSDFPGNWIVYCGTEIRKNVGVPVIVVNGIRMPEQAARLIEEDRADFVAVGRGQLADPEWARKAERGVEVNRCLECPKVCHWFVNSDDCPGRKLYKRQTGLSIPAGTTVST